MFHISNIIAVILLPAVLYILDVVLATNEYHLTHVMQMVLPKHFVGRENYSYLIILHTGGAVFIGGTVLVATGMMLVACVIHACGIFKIAR